MFIKREFHHRVVGLPSRDFPLFSLPLILLCCSLGIAASGQATSASSQQSGQQSAQASKQIEQMIPMRDGVKLATGIFLPEGTGRWPVVLIRTPYGKNTQATSNAVWTGRGFVLVVQDCRGKFKSEGEYRPFVDDGTDGYDTVEWIAKQPWSNGKVGMF